MVTGTLDEGEISTTGDEAAPERLVLVSRPSLIVVWARDASLVGTSLVLEAQTEHVFGRGTFGTDDSLPRVVLKRRRPKDESGAIELVNPFVSRHQFALSVSDDMITVRNLGKRALLGPSGAEMQRCEVHVGELLEVRGQLLFLCVASAAEPPALRGFPARSLGAFGDADAYGFVGESALAYRIRENLAFLAARNAHVALFGPSGSGKEIAARCIHRMSPRSRKALVARNAATFPATLIDAELFGNQENYPQTGMMARPGLIGEADGGTLFLDEIGELPEELQTRLLRFLDAGGEYQRLGDPKRRSADVRVVVATNRPMSALKSDLAARFKLRLTLPGLNERRDDIPLIVRHLLQQAGREDAEIAERFFENGQPRVAADLMRALITHSYTTHVRELDALLWCALSTSEGGEIELTQAVKDELAASRPATPSTPPSRRTPVEVSADEVRAALERVGWVHERAWRELGFSNRHVLKRLVKKYGIRKEP
jgi:DNA-binding NtrC family response regulator